MRNIDYETAEALVEDLDIENLELRKELVGLEALRIQGEKLLSENVRMQSTIERQKTTIQKLMGEDYDSDLDDIQIEHLKDEILQLQEQNELLKEELKSKGGDVNVKSDASKGDGSHVSKGDCSQEGVSDRCTKNHVEKSIHHFNPDLDDKNASNSLSNSVSNLSPGAGPFASLIQENQKLRLKLTSIEREFKASQELLAEADTQFDHLAGEIPIVEEKNKELSSIIIQIQEKLSGPVSGPDGETPITVAGGKTSTGDAIGNESSRNSTCNASRNSPGNTSRNSTGSPVESPAMNNPETENCQYEEKIKQITAEYEAKIVLYEEKLMQTENARAEFERESEQKLLASNEKLEAVTSEIQNLVREKEGLVMAKGELSIEKEELSMSREDLLGQLLKAQSPARDAQLHVRKSAAEVQATEESTVHATLQRQLEQMNEDFRSQKQELWTQIESLRTEKEHLHTENEELSTKADKLESEKQDLSTELEELSSQKQKLATAKQQLTVEKQEMQKQVDIVESEKVDLETQLQIAEREIESTKSCWHELLQLRQNKGTIEKEYLVVQRELEEKCHVLENQLEGKSQICGTLQMELEKQSKKFEDISKKLVEKSKELDESNVILEHHVQSYHEETTILKQENGTLKDENDNLRDENATLKEEKAVLEKTLLSLKESAKAGTPVDEARQQEIERLEGTLQQYRAKIEKLERVKMPIERNRRVRDFADGAYAESDRNRSEDHSKNTTPMNMNVSNSSSKKKKTGRGKSLMKLLSSAIERQSDLEKELQVVRNEKHGIEFELDVTRQKHQETVKETETLKSELDCIREELKISKKLTRQTEEKLKEFIFTSGEGSPLRTLYLDPTNSIYLDGASYNRDGVDDTSREIQDLPILQRFLSLRQLHSDTMKNHALEIVKLKAMLKNYENQHGLTTTEFDSFQDEKQREFTRRKQEMEDETRAEMERERLEFEKQRLAFEKQKQNLNITLRQEFGDDIRREVERKTIEIQQETEFQLERQKKELEETKRIELETRIEFEEEIRKDLEKDRDRLEKQNLNLKKLILKTCKKYGVKKHDLVHLVDQIGETETITSRVVGGNQRWSARERGSTRERGSGNQGGTDRKSNSYSPHELRTIGRASQVRNSRSSDPTRNTLLNRGHNDPTRSSPARTTDSNDPTKSPMTVVLTKLRLSEGQNRTDIVAQNDHRTPPRRTSIVRGMENTGVNRNGNSNTTPHKTEHRNDYSTPFRHDKSEPGLSYPVSPEPRSEARMSHSDSRNDMATPPRLSRNESYRMITSTRKSYGSVQSTPYSLTLQCKTGPYSPGLSITKPVLESRREKNMSHTTTT